MEDLTPEQFGELRLALVALEQELRDLLELSKEGARPVDREEPIGRLSRMDAMQQQSMVVANRAQHSRRLQQVERALKAVENGEYGVCASCEEPIGVVRLRARPEAVLCVECQDSAESIR